MSGYASRKSKTKRRKRPKGVTTGKRSRIGNVGLEPLYVRQIAYRICGPDAIKLAKQYLSIKQQYPQMTLPEGIVFIILKELRQEFVYQADAYGGRVIQGGQVPDFMVVDLAMVIRVQGDYWHSRADQRAKDIVDKINLFDAFIAGQRVKFVIDVWESRILSCDRKRVIELALQGQEVGI